MYLANNTRPDICFAVSLLARFSSSPTKRHWNGVKHILRYLRGTMDMGLFYSNESKSELIGYADAGYLSDPHKARSQTGYLFTCGDTAISWRSMKQTLNIPTTMYEDNAACIAQLKGGYIKGDRTKHISPKFFFTHDLQQNGEIEVQQIRSSDNLADLFTKALPTSTFEKLRYKIGMRRLRDIK
ncbi:secreted RxLR effector protein 161-like [Solanum lycopersicum]|uniref:secreted RxLR effector protein 161-like n=1 Tax=Solanum lycopersicum TaxID=4081 RepID=UPI0037497030